VLHNQQIIKQLHNQYRERSQRSQRPIEFAVYGSSRCRNIRRAGRRREQVVGGLVDNGRQFGRSRQLNAAGVAAGHQVEYQALGLDVDVLSLHIPLNDETHYMIDEKFISEMKKNFYFINTSRGKNVKTSALIDGLESGKVRGACLDVLEYEKSSFENLELKNDDLQYLLNSEKVIITPHIAGWTHQSKIKLAQIIVDKILSEFSK